MHAVQFTNLSSSDGSAIMSSGDTVVQAGVHGPCEIKVSKELCDKAVVEVSIKPVSSQSDNEERLAEYFIRSSLEAVILTTLHPRTSINIFLQEIQDAGNLLACCVNAACLALLDAGISMSGIVAAVPVGIIENKLIPFPSSKEIQDATAVITISIENTGKNVVGLNSSAFITAGELKKCIEVAKQAADELFQFYRDSMSKRYKKTENYCS